MMKEFLTENWFTLVTVGAMLIAFFALQTRGDKLPSTEAFDSRIRAGVPTLVEFYSNT
jgi:hypothetical protein